MKKWGMAIPSFMAAGVAALPVLTCPLCWPLYAGLLSALGLGFVDYTPYLLPVTVVLLVVSLLPLGWKARQRRGYLPLALGIAAIFLVIGGKFYYGAALVFYAGVGLLLSASLWNIWPKNNACSSCVENTPAPINKK